MKTIQLELFKFNELSESAQMTAIENERNSDSLQYYYDAEIDYLTNGALIGTGFKIDEISFSGFYSQGDGASFIGYYDSSLIDLEKLQGFSLKLYNHMISIDSVFGASGLTSDNVITANVNRISRHYSHCNTVAIDDIEINGCGWGDNECDKINIAYNDIEKYLNDLKNSICNYIYESLEDEYEHQTSDEYIADLLTINEYDFLADGTIYFQ